MKNTNALTQEELNKIYSEEILNKLGYYKEVEPSKFQEITDELANLALLSAPAVVLTTMVAKSPYYGASAITSSLKILGGSRGMMGGAMFTLPLIGLLSYAGIKAMPYVKVEATKLIEKASPKLLAMKNNVANKIATKIEKSKTRKLIVEKVNSLNIDDFNKLMGRVA